MNSLQFGLKPHHLQLICDVIERQSAVTSACFFGSRALGTYKDRSDIDIALEGDALTLNDLAAMLEKFEQSTLPYKVDLVVKHQITSPELLDHITRYGVTITP
ncbi:nucleotidyltransferase [Vibrio sp. 10N.286.49.B3]|uniref:nucleotidyltransferase family protein n=1 Tax=Vibrio sp. 10N.286.49.B3 TaxID=1880855 RepID=UPI000C830D91|nr:nucleotidyltransferase domain-containing protein [Vibrio sp. 10N.286.49.B3]PMH42156.1 nucleotidyltransferase [Vibrio sp. 10N.286.49.B3]